MPSVVINPGSGPVDGASVEQAEANMRQFAADLTERGHLVEYERTPERDADGRWAWTVDVDNSDNWQTVDMPGLPLERVRWLGPAQDIWQFPRLYVDGSSWIWFFALNQFRDNGLDAPSPNDTVTGGDPYVITTVKLNDNEESAR